jgi:hypothetical protein
VKDWLKLHNYPPSLYMPRWKENELIACAGLIRPSSKTTISVGLPGLYIAPIEASVVKERIAMFGLIARPVFLSDTSLPEMTAALENAIVSCDLRQVASLAGWDLEVQPLSSSWLLHYEVDEKDFSITEAVFTSAYVSRRLWEQSEVNGRVDLHRFLDLTDNYPDGPERAVSFLSPRRRGLLRRGGTYFVYKFVNPLTGNKRDKAAPRLPHWSSQDRRNLLYPLCFTILVSSTPGFVSVSYPTALNLCV